MASRFQFYSTIAERTADDVVHKRGKWMNFLDAAARMYKYPFPDQIMIYAQRPDAIACAPIELWNEKFNRFVRRGSKGIALIDDTGSYPRIKYVFDVNDTEPSRNNDRPVSLWMMGQEHKVPVLQTLAKSYDDVNDSLADSFRNIAKQLAAEYYQDNAREIRYSAENSFLEEYDDFNLGTAFENVLATSIAYTLMSRCGLDTTDYFDEDDFGELYNFNTPNMVYALGTATSELSEQVLRDIELIIKKHERQHAAERSVTHEQGNQLHTNRGLSSAGHQTGRTAEGFSGAVRTVRTNEEIVSERTQDDNLQLHVAVGETVPPPSGDRGSGERENGTGDKRLDSGEPVTRQTGRFDGLDGGNERLESASRGNGTERADLRIDDEEPGAIPAGGAVEQTVPSSIPEAITPTHSPLNNTLIIAALSTSSVTLDEVDSILRDGGNDKNSILRVTAYMAKNKTLEENTKFLRREYLMGRWGRKEIPGGKGFQFGTQPTSIWFDESGITVGRGNSALSSRDFAAITWEQAAERVKALYDAGQYVSHDVLDEALYNESLECADDVIEVYGNISRGLGDIQYELCKAMDKEQKEATENNWKDRRYLIRGLEELSNTVDEALNTESKVKPEEIMELYNKTIQLSEQIPPEWNYHGAYPEAKERIAELLRDKGELDENEISQGIGYSELSEYGLILHRLREDVAALDDEPDVPIRFWRNPYRVLSDLENAGLPPHSFPAAKYQPLNFMRFITDDEIDNFLMRGGTYSEGKMRFLSHFLHEHTPKENEQFVKDEYGHGGGTWIDGWSNAEPGKGIELKRPGCDDVKWKYNKVVKRINELVHSGRYMTHAELDRIPDYETIILARQINNFYYNLEEYTSPFEKDLDFHYAKDAEWQAVRGFLSDSEKVDQILGEMQYIYANTSEEDRYYDYRKTGYERLSAYRDGEYTLFPGLDKLPTPELAINQRRRSAAAFTEQSENTQQLTLFDYNTPELIAETPLPVLTGEKEQQAKIEQNNEQTAEINASAVSLPITQNEIDALLMTVTDENKARIAAQFTDNPRSRVAVGLIREIYGGIVETIPRLDGADGYLGVLGEDTGIAITRGAPASMPDRPPTETMVLSWAAIIRRVTELVENGQFDKQIRDEKENPIFAEYLKIKADNPGYVVLYQLGDFYEAFQDDAELIAETLDLTLTTRSIGIAEAVNMVGVPSHKLEEYVQKLRDDTGVGVAISSVGDNGERTVSLLAAIAEISKDKTTKDPAQEFDISIAEQTTYERVIQDDFITMLEAETMQITEAKTELDFDTVAQTILERVMQDAEYAEALTTAQSRGALRNQLNTVLDKVINKHEPNETEIYNRYYSDDDFNDRLFDFVYHQSWANRPTLETLLQTEETRPRSASQSFITDEDINAILRQALENRGIMLEIDRQFKENSRSREAETLLRKAYDDCDFFGTLPDGSFCHLRCVTGEKNRVIFVKRNSEDERELNWTWLQLQLRITQLVETGQFLNADEHATQHLSTEIAGEQTKNDGTTEKSEFEKQSQSITEPKADNPPPVFFVDWEKAQHDFELNLYNDGDIIGYNKDGVEYKLGRSGNFSYVTETGALWGNNGVPGNIYEQINKYRNGELTDDQVKENYINVLNTFRDFKAADLEEANGDLIDVLENGLFSQAEKDSIRTLLESSYKNDEILSLISDAYKDRTETMILTSGETTDYRTSANGLEIEILDKFNTTLFFSWVDIAPIVRALAVRWQAELAPEHEVSVTTDQSESHESVPSKTTGMNFHITDDHLGEGGAKTKFRYNMDAINTLQEIEFEKRNATPEEQQILSRYVGWGGLQQAFDPDNKQWENEYLELNAALSPEEWESARASTPNAHYTTPTVIKAIYETVGRMGYTSGNILEPSCGVGNFFGLLPDSMKKSKLYGVELDGISARIAKQLYPKANIKQMGFEETDTPDAFFDLAIGNIPFGDYGVADKRYNKHHFSIHNYFFAKALDQVRPGGVIAFLTSKYMMDERNPTVRKYLAQKAELLGAVRLPNNAFLKNAGTEVTSDIIFLQKRDRPIDIEPEWVHLGQITDNNEQITIPVNSYFANNPEMILGKMGLDERMNNKYGRDNITTCLPTEGADLAQQLKTALLNIQGEYTEPELDDIDGVEDNSIPADTHIRNFSYALVTLSEKPDADDGEYHATHIGTGDVYFRENSRMYPVDLPASTLERIKGMCALRDCVGRLIGLQLEEHSDDAIKAEQDELNDLYDRFTAEYGLINATANSRAFNSDSAYYLLCSLEILDEDGNLESKADMFTKRTIKQKNIVTHVDTASQALAVSLGERAHVDLAYMSQLTGKDEDTLKEELRGVVFLNTGSADSQEKAYVTADEYLSGNVRDKLAQARAAHETLLAHGDDSLAVNVAALEAAQPKELEAPEISVRLGATWIEPEYVHQFMQHLFKTPYRMQGIYQVKYYPFTNEWQVTGKGRALYNDITATVAFGTSRMNAYEILHDTLNLKDVRIYDYKEDADGKEQRVLNKKETTLVQQKQEQIKQAFKDWIWQDPDRRQYLVEKYNKLFNSTRPREYDGSHIELFGATPEISFRKHQANAVARQMYGGNTLLAHVVGAGKTFEMIAAAMEMKRIGLCHKSLFAVPNHLTEQWAGEFLRLYPSANILVATKKDFEMCNRRKFCAKIATGDYDAVIIGHSQLEKIPMSKERQERLLREQLYEIEDGIDELQRTDGERFSIKQLEKTKKSIEVRLKKLLDGTRRDDVVTFEQLGVDRLFVDEAHSFKNLFMYTKMRNVAGLSTSEAQKSSDLFMKCRYMDELTDNKGVIFATGTPISNSMTEMYTMQRYLQYDKLMAKDLTHFDCWASIFGETQTSIELAPEGTGYRARTRFSRFHNLPELMAFFKEVADIQTADMLGLPVPKANYETVVVEPSDLQKDMVQELSERAAAVHARLVDPSIDNMLKITTDGRKIGLDQRLINPMLPDFEGSKINACADNVFNIWNDTKNDHLTQLVFCDFSTPKKDGRFNVYDDMRNKLIEKGVPIEEIAFIHDADNETKKKELFAKVRHGKVRVLFGSTFKMGAGSNVQDRLVAIHDADCPWRPADLEQRAGRIVRQGNKNEEVSIFRYVTSSTFDAYLYQTLENKQKFIAQIMSSKSPVRSCEDVDESVLSYAEIKALCAGNPLIKEKMDLDIEVARLRLLKSDHQSQRFRLEDDLLKHFPAEITEVKERITGIEKDIALYKEEHEKTIDVQATLTGDGETASAATITALFPGMTVNGVEYTEKEPAAKALIEATKTYSNKSDAPFGKYMGFDMKLSFSSINKAFSLYLRGSMTYQVDLGMDTFGNITRINNALAELPKHLEGAKSQLETLYSGQEAAKQELEKPFTLAEQLKEKENRLALLNAELNIDGEGGLDVINDAADRAEAEPEPDDEFDYESEYSRTASKSEKPSLMDGIRSWGAGKQQSDSGKKVTEYNI